MKTGGKNRTSGKTRTGIEIDENLMNQVAKIAQEQFRSRNNMIEVMLREQVAKYKAEQQKPADPK